MTAYYAGASAPSFAVANRLEAFAASAEFDRPTLVIDVDRVETQYDALKAGLGRADIHYAVKANPHPAIIERLVQLGSHFDAASRGEIELCLSQGARPEHVSFGNTIKRVSDIAFAYGAGIRMFAVDAEEELEKIAEHAPGAQVYVRLIVETSSADWPLTRKFGCDRDTALKLLDRATELGLEPLGFSFHVGSQTRHAEMWVPVLDELSRIWTAAQEAGHKLQLLNIGGGFPAFYGEEIQAPTDYAAAVMELVEARFPGAERVMAEPGRGMVAEAGVIACEVMLTSRKSDRDMHRWVYLSIGRFSGLAETEGEAIRYQFVTPHDGEATGPCILAGPSCDSADVLYEKRPMNLPLNLKSGDRVLIRNTGAYTSTYSSVCFNGFPPLDVVVL
ncbi:ornithine decarboxylase [Limimaricola soesokkakensis]|uniref:ornithine decarboxylase n=1 Tax=Limimaricola soesokkakensis TaxID=1343159 RepID=A0A1X6YDN4_9RHOB|nr:MULTISPECIES: type III PLP-dependent enzyme [Limimaricola]MCZ4262928.1 type III PLP-dependent enzyme [Limimaricola sp. G21655-S1]PSK80208.1 ornithine decarboxylase [Limimaricola soesokkakensis]SLN18368.1 Lysine/ornithine decarboxylase [Limimaricola soesokkakensis]